MTPVRWRYQLGSTELGVEPWTEYVRAETYDEACALADRRAAEVSRRRWQCTAGEVELDEALPRWDPRARREALLRGTARLA